MKQKLLLGLLAMLLPIAAWAADGDVFTYEHEGVTVTYTVLSETDKTCQVGYLDGSSDKTAVLHYLHGAVTIPAQVSFNGITYNVVKIGKYALFNTYNTTSIILPSTLTTIDDHAFRACYSLKSFTLPKNVMSIGQGVLGDCRSLTTLTVDSENAKYSSPEGSNVIIETSTKTLVAAANGAVIPSSVTKIPDNMFEGFAELNMTIPSTITTIGNSAFSRISGSIITVESATPLEISENVFADVNKREWSVKNYLRVPTGSKNAYLNAQGWSEFGEDYILEGDEGATFAVPTVEGVDVIYTILNDETKTCMVGYLNGSSIWTAVNREMVEGTLTIPAQVTYNGNTYNVVKIGPWAFHNANHIYSIVLPSTLTAIDNYAFQYCGLNTFVLPKNVIAIGEGALYGCRNINTMTVEAGNAKYSSPEGSNVIIETASNTLVEVAKTAVIPATVTNIPDNLFERFEGLNLTIPSTITSIGNRAFANISNSTITVESTTPLEISDEVFYRLNQDGYDNNYLRVPAGAKDAYLAATGWSQFGADNILSGNDGMTFTATTSEGVEVTYAILDDAANTCRVGYLDGSSDKTAVKRDVVRGTVTIPAQVTYDGRTYNVVKIGQNAFWNVYNLNSIVLPSTLEAIDENAFQYCGGLNTFTLPKNVTSIGARALSGCSNLATLTVEAGNTKYSSPEGSNVIIETASNTLVAVAKTAVIPATVTEIPDNMFEDFNGLSLSIPSTITAIGNRAFAYISNSTITVENGNPMAISENVFDGVSGRNNYLRVPAGSKDTYLAAAGWNKFGADYILEGNAGMTFTATTPEGVEVTYTILDDEAKTCQVGYLDGNYDKKAADTNSIDGKLTIPDNVNGYTVVKIGKHAFQNAYKMTEVDIPSTVTAIDELAFNECSSLTSFTVKKNLTSLSERAFCRFNNLETVTVETDNSVYESPEGSNVVMESASKKVITGAKNFIIPAEATMIADWAFPHRHNAIISIPTSVSAIGEYAFGWIWSSTITVGWENPIEIGDRVFSGVNDEDNEKCTLVVPDGTKEAYLAATGWSQFGADYIIEASEFNKVVIVETEDGSVIKTEIEAEVTNADAKEVKITSASIPESEGSATAVAIPATYEIDGVTYSVTSIADNAFAGKTEITDIYLPVTNKAIEIGENALKIDDENIATIHSPMALLDDYAQNLFLKQNVEAGKLMATVKAPNKYWTFSCGIDVVIPENIKVYTCMIANASEVKITEIDEEQLTIDGQRIIKANNGVLVACPDDDTVNAYDIVAASNVKAATGDAKSYGEDNWLEPVVESKNYSADDYYVLKDGEFHVIIANDSKVPACKAVLRKPAGVAATRSLTIVGDGTTSIGERTKVDGAADEWFTISGQRISKPTTKGLYINNGKKVIIK